MLGLEATQDLVTASSLCGACGEVCPVKIPIPDLLIQLRQQSQGNTSAPLLRGAGRGRKTLQSISYRLFSALYSRPALYRLFSLAATRLRALAPARQGAWTDSRTPLRPAARSLHERMNSRNRKSGG